MLRSVYQFNDADTSFTRIDSFPRLKFVVTMTNLKKKPFYFNEHLKFSYKEYKDWPWYLEAADMEGNPVNIFGGFDIDWIIDPTPEKYNINKIVYTISTDIYKFGPGKYKVRWVYDPDFDKPKPQLKPAFSDWQEIEILK